ncbi:tubulin epsilon [Babesia ovis]|uniref:Tubulin epsilon n=1 Tax=Babesia ovis TaxID=5869 RepID=A0A9W5WUN5_BABOV|nr:tubulin epsilon [Babesia ovis]
MKDILSINIGQCGVQIASCFWESFFKDLKTRSENPTKVLDDVKSFVTHPEIDRSSDYTSLDMSDSFIRKLRAKCILIDTDLSTISEVLQKQQLCQIEGENIICGTEATGNNWSTAFFNHGPLYHDAIEELLASNLEGCDESFQYFNLTFGLSGGTGGGLGSYILDILSDNYSKVHRICNVITQESMAVVSPYNTLFCLQHLNDMSSMTTLFSNEALLRQSSQSTAQILRDSNKDLTNKEYGFNEENAMISSHMKEIGLAAVSDRFPSFTMSSILNTLTPFPELNIMCPCMVPKHYIKEGIATELQTNELIRPCNRISPIPQKERSCPMAMAIYGNFNSSSMKYIKRLKLKHNMVGWMRDAIKISLPGSFAKQTNKLEGMYGFSNDCALSSFLKTAISNFERLYAKKAFLHHFSDTLDSEDFSTAKDHMEELHTNYTEIAKYMIPPHHLLDETSIASLGVKLEKANDLQCRDPWNNVPGSLNSDKRYWWDLNGKPLL